MWSGPVKKHSRGPTDLHQHPHTYCHANTHTSNCTYMHICTELTASAQACLPSGDLDLGYQIQGSPFNGTFIVVRHDEESIAAANAPVSTVFSSGVCACVCRCMMSACAPALYLEGKLALLRHLHDVNCCVHPSQNLTLTLVASQLYG